MSESESLSDTNEHDSPPTRAAKRAKLEKKPKELACPQPPTHTYILTLALMHPGRRAQETGGSPGSSASGSSASGSSGSAASGSASGKKKAEPDYTFEPDRQDRVDGGADWVVALAPEEPPAAQPEEEEVLEDYYTAPAEAEKEVVQTLHEHINPKALQALCQRRTARAFRLSNGQGPTVARVCADLLAQVDSSRLPDGAALLRTVWCEETRARSAGCYGRRYSGAGHTELDGRFKKLEAKGVCKGALGVSTFSLPRWLRAMARAGLPNRFEVDLENAHVRFLHRRHPDLTHVAAYVGQREETLALLPVPRDAAKELFLRALYGGSAQAWAREHGVNVKDLPPVVAGFVTDVEVAKQRDADRNPALLAKLADEAKPTEVLQHLLNTTEERKAVDAITAALQPHAKLLAWEHDGVFVHAPKTTRDAIKAAAEAACGLPVKVTHTLSIEAALRQVRARLREDKLQSCFAADRFWDQLDGKWLDYQALVRRACTEPLRHHGLFAEVALGAAVVSLHMPYALEEIFKVQEGRLMWYSSAMRRWIVSEPGSGALKDAICTICQTQLSPYLLLRGDSCAPDLLRWDVSNDAFKTSVEKALLHRLIADEQWHLDPASSLRWLNFNGEVFDRESGALTPMRPDMLISRSTNWDFTEPSWAGSPQESALLEALTATRRKQEEKGYNEATDFDDSLEQLFEAVNLTELAFWFSLTRSWEVVVYYLMHLARAVFGMTMAEALWTRGPGRNGKDTVCNLLHAILGSYALSIYCEALCRIKDPDAPTPTFAKCRARRVVCVREVGGEIVPMVYKRFTDPQCTLQGRDLYEKLVMFKPQHLAFFASNNMMRMACDMAVRARTACIGHVSVFKDKPVEANEAQWQDMSALIGPSRPGHFRLLWLVYKTLLHGRQMRNVHPVPVSCRTLRDSECQDEDRFDVKELLSKLKPVKKAGLASLAEEVEALVPVQFVGQEKRGPRDVLGAAGFATKRTKRGGKNIEVYMYAFTDENNVKQP